jgi:hypothetical protein
MPVTDESSDQKGRPGCSLRCGVLILALLGVSVVMCSLIGCAAGQVELQPEVEKKATQHSTCYAVQVGAYKKRTEAVTMLVKLAETIPYPMMLTEVVARDNVRWRLRVLTTSRVEADKASERLLAEQGVQTWIVPMTCKERLEGGILTPRTETPGPATNVQELAQARRIGDR